MKNEYDTVFDINKFELFKSNLQHEVKEMGQLSFIKDVLVKGRVDSLWEENNYLCALYVLAMLDYLSRINGLPLYNKYNELRTFRFEEPIYPLSVRVEAALSGEIPIHIKENAIKEFSRHNIIEGDIFNVA